MPAAWYCLVLWWCLQGTNTISKKRQNLKSRVVVLFIELEVSLERMGRLNVTDVRRERTLLLWSTVRATALAKAFCSNHTGVCLQKNEAAWKVHS